MFLLLLPCCFELWIVLFSFSEFSDYFSEFALPFLSCFFFAPTHPLLLCVQRRRMSLSFFLSLSVCLSVCLSASHWGISSLVVGSCRRWPQPLLSSFACNEGVFLFCLTDWCFSVCFCVCLLSCSLALLQFVCLFFVWLLYIRFSVSVDSLLFCSPSSFGLFSFHLLPEFAVSVLINSLLFSCCLSSNIHGLTICLRSPDYRSDIPFFLHLSPFSSSFLFHHQLLLHTETWSTISVAIVTVALSTTSLFASCPFIFSSLFSLHFCFIRGLAQKLLSYLTVILFPSIPFFLFFSFFSCFFFHFSFLFADWPRSLTFFVLLIVTPWTPPSLMSCFFLLSCLFSFQLLLRTLVSSLDILAHMTSTLLTSPALLLSSLLSLLVSASASQIGPLADFLSSSDCDSLNSSVPCVLLPTIAKYAVEEEGEKGTRK